MDLAPTIKILLVEDEPGDVYLIKEFLSDQRSSTYEIFNTKTIAECKEHIRMNILDIILLDLGLPDCQGIETLEEIMDHSRDLPIIVLTGLDNTDIGQKAVDLGAQDYLVKGKFDAEVLRRVISYAICRKRFEIDRRREAERAQEYLNIAGVMILTRDRNGDVTLINQKGAQILGYEVDEIIGKNWFDNFLPVEKRDWMQSRYSKIIDGTERIRDSFENAIINAEGKERIILWNNIYLKGQQGEIIGILSSGEDITERKKLELRIRESERTYKLLAENQSDVVFSISIDGTLEYVSPSIGSFGSFDPSKIIGSHIQDYWADQEEFDLSVDTMVRMIKKRSSGKFQFMFKPKEGTNFPVEVVATPVVKNDWVMAFNCVMRDVTDRIEAEKLRDEFLSILTHDLGTPLMAVSTNIEILRSGSLGTLNEEQLKRLQIMEKGAERLGLLREDTLQLSKFDLGKLKLKRQIVDLNDLIIGTIDEIDNIAHKKGLKIEHDLEEDIMVSCDVPKIKRVLDNYFSNSIKYSDGGTRISITSKRNGNEVVIAVIDEGRGLGSEELEKVFDRFYRTGLRVEGSTGLGLSIVKEIVESHGGQAWVESDGIGKGSNFFFSLPLIQDTETSGEVKS